MKFKLFSVIVGNEACIASCPFCVSGIKPDTENMRCPDINWRNFKIACNLANRSNVDTVMLTSRGEPLLFPKQITEYLERLEIYNFPFIELQTNGILFGNKPDYYKAYLKKWYKLGLTTICLSVVSNHYDRNKKIYTPNGKYIDLKAVIKYLHTFGFSIRLTCVMCSGMMDSIQNVEEFILYAKANNVEQVTLRPVNDEFRRQSAKRWIEENRLSEEEKESISQYLEKEGTRLLELDRLGAVYDVYGQNVMLSVPLNKDTRDMDPENGRQLIFFQDGHLKYEWEKEGGILL